MESSSPLARTKRAGNLPAFFCLKIGLFRYSLLFVGTYRIHDSTRFISIDHSLLHELQTLSNRNANEKRPQMRSLL